MLYNSMSQLYIYTHISLPLEPFPTLPIHPSSHSGAPSWVPSAIQRLPTTCVFYTWQCINVKAALWVCPMLSFPLLPTSCPQVHSLCLCLYSCPENRFISAIFPDSIYIYVLIYDMCFSLSDLQPLGAVYVFCLFLIISLPSTRM